jgi:hypothetical protein
VQSLNLLLLDRLDWNRPNLCRASGFDKRRRVGFIGLVALDVSSYVLCRQELNIVPQASDMSRPVMRTSAGFHDHTAPGPLNKKGAEPCTRKAVPLKDPPIGAGCSDLEYVLRQVHANDRNIHALTPLGNR